MPNPLELLRAEIEAIIARHALRTGRYQTDVPGLQVARLTQPLPPTTFIAEASICVCVRGARAVTIGRHAWRQDEDHYLLTTVGLPNLIAIDRASPKRPYTALRIDLDLALARDVMADLDIESRGTQPASLLSLGTIDREFLDAVARLVRLIDAPADTAFMSPLVHREILYRILSSPSAARLRQIIQLESHGHRAARAVAWLRGHFADRLKVEQLATVAGMAVSTLHRHFHALTGMSPIQYQKQLRLHAARRRMLDDQSDVGSTALSVGYESSTQFIRDYRRLFGQPPLRDVKALRERNSTLAIPP